LRRPPPPLTPFPYTTLFRSGFGEIALRRMDEHEIDVGPVFSATSNGIHAPLQDLVGATETFGDAQAGLFHLIGDSNGVFERGTEDRKSTRLNSSHVKISYAV